MHALLIALAACCLGQQRFEKVYPYRGARSIETVATLNTWTNGDADGDWGAVGNWGLGAVPDGSTHHAIFDGGVTQTGPSTGLDRTGETLGRLIVKKNFTGDIGGAGNYLLHNLRSEAELDSRLIHRGPGDVYFKPYDPDPSGPFDNDVVVDGPGHLYLDSEAGVVGGRIAHVFVKSGNVTIAATCDLSSTYDRAWIILCGASANVTIAAGAAARAGHLVVWDGLLTNGRTVQTGDNIVVFRGKLIQTGAVEDGAIVLIGPDGRMEYTTATTLTSAHNPDVLSNGALDVEAIRQEIQFRRWIQGPRAQTVGENVSIVDPSTGVQIDLQEEYP